MDHDFWQKRWEEGKIGFHQTTVNPRLLRFADRMAPPGKRVLVPLAGKSNDMEWLRQRGDEVVGAELSRIAVEAFYEEHSLVPVVTETGAFQRFESPGIVMFVGDFLALEPHHTGAIDWVFDRAAFYALPPEMRVRYAAHLTSLLARDACILLLTIEYDDTKASGPPFSIRKDQVRRSFSPAFSLEVLDEEPVDVGNPRLEEAGITDMVETTWLLKKL